MVLLLWWNFWFKMIACKRRSLHVATTSDLQLKLPTFWFRLILANWVLNHHRFQPYDFDWWCTQRGRCSSNYWKLHVSLFSLYWQTTTNQTMLHINYFWNDNESREQRRISPNIVDPFSWRKTRRIDSSVGKNSSNDGATWLRRQRRQQDTKSSTWRKQTTYRKRISWYVRDSLRTSQGVNSHACFHARPFLLHWANCHLSTKIHLLATLLENKALGFKRFSLSSLLRWNILEREVALSLWADGGDGRRLDQNLL